VARAQCGYSLLSPPERFFEIDAAKGGSDAMGETAGEFPEARNAHYNEHYFSFINDSSIYSSVIDRFKFENEVRPTDKLIDFGCGGGYMLSALQAAEKIGVEVNEVAADAARKSGLTIVPALEEVEDDWADVIISHHALEHVDDPLAVIRLMRAKVKPGGKIVIVTPDESFKMRYRENDPNFHLFTWSPSNLGNLLKRAGFVGIRSDAVHHRWPPYWWIIGGVLGPKLMHYACVVHGRLRTGISQVKAVGYRPNAM
jgi:SAM-dependent methyltransferase